MTAVCETRVDCRLYLMKRICSEHVDFEPKQGQMGKITKSLKKNP